MQKFSYPSFRDVQRALEVSFSAIKNPQIDLHSSYHAPCTLTPFLSQVFAAVVVPARFSVPAFAIAVAAFALAVVVVVAPVAVRSLFVLYDMMAMTMTVGRHEHASDCALWGSCNSFLCCYPGPYY